MPDNYSPRFQHQDWRDGADLVSAEDPAKGFNKRFRDLQQEFQEIARIVGQINGSLAPPTTTLTFAPSFSPNGTNRPWDITPGIATKPNNQTSAEGWLAVQLPQGSRIESINVIGEKSGNTANPDWAFRVELIRQVFNGTPTTLLSLNLKDRPANSLLLTPIQGREPIPVANNLVDNQTNKYIVTARVSEAESNSVVRIFAIQFVCRQT